MKHVGLNVAADSLFAASVSTGQGSYPDTEQICQLFAQVSERIYLIPAMEIAEALGNARTNNIVLLSAVHFSGRAGGDLV